MYKNKKILAIIPARGGSKGIPKKNIVNLSGHPLLAYSIGIAKLSKFIDRTIVSTDSREMAQIAKRYGAEVPFLRPKKYAKDASVDMEFFKHALDWLKKHEAYVPDLIVHLRPTTPTRESKMVDKAILEMINNPNATALRSGHLFDFSAYKLFKAKNGYMEFFGKKDFKPGIEYQNFARQKLPPTYKTNGYIDVVLPKIIKTGKLHGKKIRAFITEEVADINNLRDLEFAEQTLKNKKYIDLINFLKQYD